ncbi:MAG: hypothetical protein COB35_01470 [Gammaproteobacteria bacterium]|nr:MAG: hypothetical protein COB35_01470 [Gammaproteobacteria bacterium]
MKLAELSFSGLPPIDVPFRYFISAPLFIIAIAIMILFNDDPLWASRWQAATLAITHAFTLGFMASIMMGAIYQLLPVTSGISFPKPRLIAGFCHLFHTTGSVLLIVGFLTANRLIQITAALSLALGFSIYLYTLAYMFYKNKQKNVNNYTLKGIKLAFVALLITVILGLLLQGKLAGLIIIEWDRDLTNLHASWGLFAWVSILIISISFQVIPMFYVAAEFHLRLKKYISLSLFSSLIVMLLIKLAILPLYLQTVIQYILLLIGAIYTFYLLKTINSRKRKISDTSINYWQLASISFLFILITYAIPKHYLANIIENRADLLFTAIFIFMVIVSILQGMLLKILPFLVFTHLQQQCGMNFNAMQMLPKMQDILCKPHASILFTLHLISSINLLTSIFYPQWYWLFACALIVEFTWLTFLIAKAFYLYRLNYRKISSQITKI